MRIINVFKQKNYLSVTIKYINHILSEWYFIKLKTLEMIFFQIINKFFVNKCLIFIKMDNRYVQISTQRHRHFKMNKLLKRG